MGGTDGIRISLGKRSRIKRDESHTKSEQGAGTIDISQLRRIQGGYTVEVSWKLREEEVLRNER